MGVVYWYVWVFFCCCSWEFFVVVVYESFLWCMRVFWAGWEIFESVSFWSCVCEVIWHVIFVPDFFFGGGGLRDDFWCVWKVCFYCMRFCLGCKSEGFFSWWWKVPERPCVFPLCLKIELLIISWFAEELRFKGIQGVSHTLQRYLSASYY